MSNWRTDINTNHKYQDIQLLNLHKETIENLVKLTDDEFFSIMDVTKSSSIYKENFGIFISTLQKNGGLELIQKFALDIKQAPDKIKVYDDYNIKYIIPLARELIKISNPTPKLKVIEQLTDKELYFFSKYTFVSGNKSVLDDDKYEKLILSGDLKKFINDKLINIPDTSVINSTYMDDNIKLYESSPSSPSSSSSSSSPPWYKNTTYIIIISAISIIICFFLLLLVMLSLKK